MNIDIITKQHIYITYQYNSFLESTTTGIMNISENYQQTANSISHTGRIVIIFAGSIISLLLLSMIIREICTYRRISN